MAVLIALGAFVMTLIGGLVAQHIGDRRHLVLGLAAGLMLGVVGFDLLPEALDLQADDVFGVPAALLMFVGGFLTLHIVERSVAIHRAHEGEYAAHTHAHGPVPTDPGEPVKGIGLTAASALVGHSVMDGFAIGAAFQAGSTVGLVVAIAVVAHDFADGFNTYTITRMYGNGQGRALVLLGCDAIAPVIGAAITLAFTIPPGALGLYLGFFAGFLLYLATSDILPEAHSPHPSRSTLLCTVAGCAVMWLVIGLAD
ncbi:ZIP family metal transporter [Streptomyces sp. SID13666]|uniref:ZIP family metal transporter n=1 Tax=Streptomyces TaxID=1883 RepID=UPI001105A38E|nr:MULTISPECIES: ZIP family metal transporter [Streptomyces]MCZ4103184.1 ZIP family metal transporter [Streptomyces sp. H39-C1]NEA59678.1 ZIP family metal transporter [Streptomyces sp. SID13666]NEA75799.1 ZIP family metal transporter [Streptomyces sp. SID13588]QNA76031.1 ZIP family metal transporter [Streptomyces sp. So13.3]